MGDLVFFWTDKRDILSTLENETKVPAYTGGKKVIQTGVWGLTEKKV